MASTRSTRKRSASFIDEATAYAEGVASGTIVAGTLVKLACERHLRDLKEGHKRGLVWRADIARHAISFFPKLLRHSKGEWARKPVVLDGWQKFCIGSVFGWLRADGTRRFRVAYEEVARKNGKSTKLAGVGLYLLAADQEDGAEIYSAATKRDQARIIFDEAKRMVGASPELRQHIQRFKLNLSMLSTHSKFEPLSADANSLDGLNPHATLIDELHKHKSRELLDVMDTAQGARRQPLTWIITTAGDDDPETVYAQENDYAIKVVEGVVEDDDWFVYIATLDKTDDIYDEANWIKANPNLGVSVKLDDLRRQARKAKKSAPALNAFKRLRLNLRTGNIDKPITAEAWNRCSRGVRIDPETLHGRRCWAGLDLSSKTDISAFVKLFEPIEDGGPLLVAARYWMPADTLEKRADAGRAPWKQWIADGWIEATPGDVIDHNEVQAAVIEDARLFDIASLAYDPWNATQLAVSAQEVGVPMVEFIQGLKSYAAPTRELLDLVAAVGFDHGGDPVLAWMASNLRTQTDKNLNLMPTKKHSTGRIDGMTALIMAIGRRLLDDGSSGVGPDYDVKVWG